MASWNPIPSIPGANWGGNQTLVTKNQLVSSISGLYADLADFSFSTISSVGTLTATQWISTPVLYVSDIRAGNIDLSGVTIDPSGVFVVQDISANQSFFNVTNVSVMKMEFKPTFSGDIKVTFDLGLGQAIGGFLAGLGAAVGGGLIAVGTGAGLAIQGAEQGIATIIAGRPQNFITNNTYETINFTSQLQVSTLGNAYPAYSSIFRTVSSISANEVPGREIFVSTLFYPGQICIRSVSDPINLITGDANINTSTIQSFGQWVPLENLEPTNIIANSVSTNFLSTGQLQTEFATIDFANVFDAYVSSLAVDSSAFFDYQAPLNFQTGATNYGALEGNLNRMYFQTTNGIIFSQYQDTTEKASLYVGSAPNSSLLNVSTINSLGAIKTVDFYASTITAENLFVVSTVTVTNTTQTETNIVSTLIADEAYMNQVFISSLSSYVFATGVGNPGGVYDITKNNFLTSTSYNSISSITNNILKYQLNIGLQDEPTFNLGGQGPGTPPVRYVVESSNAQQWNSTMLICNPTNGNAALVEMNWPGDWLTGPVNRGTFDLTVDMSKGGFFMNCLQISTPQGLNPSTFFKLDPTFYPNSNTYRFNLTPTGWWNYVSPAGAPYETVNSNSFTISQDINDVNITTTDRLNLTAGDIFLNGVTHIPNVNLDDIRANSLTTNYLSTLVNANFTSSVSFNNPINVISTLIGNDATFTTFYDTLQQPTIEVINNPRYIVPSVLSTPVNKYVPFETNFSTFYQNPEIFQGLGTGNDITLGPLGAWTINGVPRADNYAKGTFYLTPIDNTSKIYTDNNGFGLASNLTVANIVNQSIYTINLYIAFPSSAIPIPGNTSMSIYWNGGTGQWSDISYNTIPPTTFTSQLRLIQDYNSLTVAAPPTLLVSTPLVQVGQINYGTTSTGFYQPKMFRQIISGNFGTGGSDSGTTQVSNGSQAFSGSLYNCQCSIASFFCGNGSVAFNSVILAPYVDSGTNTWYVNWSIEMNAATAGASWTISWNAFMFPYNMTSS